MSHAHRPTASSKKRPCVPPDGRPHIKSDLEGDEERWWQTRFKSVRVNLEVTQSCRLLTDSALHLLKEDVSVCSFFYLDILVLLGQYTLDLQCIGDLIALHSMASYSTPDFSSLSAFIFNTVVTHVAISTSAAETNCPNPD